MVGLQPEAAPAHAAVAAEASFENRPTDHCYIGPGFAVLCRCLPGGSRAITVGGRARQIGDGGSPRCGFRRRAFRFARVARAGQLLPDGNRPGAIGADAMQAYLVPGWIERRAFMTAKPRFLVS